MGACLRSQHGVDEIIQLIGHGVGATGQLKRTCSGRGAGIPNAIGSLGFAKVDARVRGYRHPAERERAQFALYLVFGQIRGDLGVVKRRYVTGVACADHARAVYGASRDASRVIVQKGRRALHGLGLAK